VPNNGSAAWLVARFALVAVLMIVIPLIVQSAERRSGGGWWRWRSGPPDDPGRDPTLPSEGVTPPREPPTRSHRRRPRRLLPVDRRRTDFTS
jgi:hypothetical protein